MKITTKELSPDIWLDLESFFLAERRSGCWCMNHRLRPGEILEGDLAKQALASRVLEGKIFGILAYVDEQPIGWCAYDRIADLPGLDCGHLVPDDHKAVTWSIHCISVLSSFPKDEITEPMISAAVEAMTREGAKYIESYPPPSVPSDNSFSGTVEIFERQGFQLHETVNKFYTRMVKIL